MPRYQEQYQRAKRYYKRFSSIDHNDPGVTLSDECCEDIVYSCFIHIHHIKDWVENDDSSDFDLHTKSIHKFYEDNQDALDVLDTCREICNGIKHLKLTKRDAPEWISRHIEIKVSENLVTGESSGITTGIRYHVEHKEREWNAFCLATRAIGLWEKFICENLRSVDP